MITAWHESLNEWTGEMLAHRRALLRDYAPHDLHQWRVRIRRIRSLTRFLGHPDGEVTRAGWRRLFTETSAARDWDVFLERGAEWLPLDDWRRLEPALDPLRAAARQQALAMLRSQRFEDQLARWRRFLASAPGGPQKLDPSLLRHALDTVRRRRNRALERGDGASWHRLRIAVKKLRYLLEVTEEAGDSRLGLIATCEAMQDELGAAQDHHVQLELLRSSEAENALREAGLEAARLRRVEAALCRRRDEALAAARARLAPLAEETRNLRKRLGSDAPA